MLLATVLILAAPQDATLAKPQQDADGTQRWSVLFDPCANARSEEQIVVCGEALPDDAPPNRPVPSNRDLSGSGALAVTSAPCATSSQGCSTGMDLFGGATFLVRAVGKIVDPDSCCEEPGEATNPVMLVRDVVRAVKRGTKKKPDKSKRVPIPLDDPAPAPEEEAPGPAPAPDLGAADQRGWARKLVGVSSTCRSNGGRIAKARGSRAKFQSLIKCQQSRRCSATAISLRVM